MTRPGVGIIGLGIMGSAYAEHLIAAGFPVAGFDPDAAAAHRLALLGGDVVASPAELAKTSRFVLTALPSVAALETALFEDGGLVDGASPGTIVLEMSTFALEAKEAARARRHDAGLPGERYRFAGQAQGSRRLCERRSRRIRGRAERPGRLCSKRHLRRRVRDRLEAQVRRELARRDP